HRRVAAMAASMSLRTAGGSDRPRLVRVAARPDVDRDSDLVPGHHSKRGPSVGSRPTVHVTFQPPVISASYPFTWRYRSRVGPMCATSSAMEAEASGSIWRT